MDRCTEAGVSRPILHAFYDLGHTPVTYDVSQFYAMARIWALRGGFSAYRVTFALGEGGDGFRHATPKDMALSRDEKMWRLRHILMAHEAIARDCVGVEFVQRRDDLARILDGLHPAQVFPPAYSAATPSAMFLLHQMFAMQPTLDEMIAFAPTASALTRARRWLDNKGATRPVTLTLRGSTIEDHRNSRIDEWMAAADHMAARGYDPIIIPDHDLATDGFDEFGPHRVYSPGALDLDLRVAMYALADVNMAHNGGPAVLPYFMAGASQVCFLPVDNLPSVAPTVDRMACLLGIDVGGDWPHMGGPMRRFVWEPDKREAIIGAFDAAVGIARAA